MSQALADAYRANCYREADQWLMDAEQDLGRHGNLAPHNAAAALAAAKIAQVYLMLADRAEPYVTLGVIHDEH